jgi:hypothetical protein
MTRIVSQMSLDDYLCAAARDYKESLITEADLKEFHELILSLNRWEHFEKAVESCRLARHCDAPLEALLEAWEVKAAVSKKDTEDRLKRFLRHTHPGPKSTGTST